MYFSRAVELLDKQKPDYARAFFWRAMEYEAVGEQPRALADYTQAIEIMGSGNAFVPTILVNRSMTYKRMGEMGQCLADLQQAADLMHISLEELVKQVNTEAHAQHQSTALYVLIKYYGTQFELRLDDAPMSPKKDPSRRKSVSFKLGLPEEAARAQPKVCVCASPFCMFVCVFAMCICLVPNLRQAITFAVCILALNIM